jgi:hypothetical protein
MTRSEADRILALLRHLTRDQWEGQVWVEEMRRLLEGMTRKKAGNVRLDG